VGPRSQREREGGERGGLVRGSSGRLDPRHGPSGLLPPSFYFFPFVFFSNFDFCFSVLNFEKAIQA
jgi:hypothetical protein